MSLVHLHLLLNHLPVIGAFFGVLLLAVALARRSSELAKVALAFFAFLGAVSVAVFFTGEPAEELIEKLPGFSEAITERHEELALVATIAMAGLGALALLVLAAFRRRPLPRGMTIVGLVAAVGVSALMAYVANLGGQIRHTEIRPGVSASAAVTQPTELDERVAEAGERPGRW